MGLWQSKHQLACTRTIMLTLSWKNMGLTTGKSKYIKVISSKLESSNTQKYLMSKEPFRTSRMDMPITRQGSWGMDPTRMEVTSKMDMDQEILSRSNFSQKRENSGLGLISPLLKWPLLQLILKKEGGLQQSGLCTKEAAIVLPYLIFKIDLVS